ncbi:peptidase inhibitor family I36 protein [Streptomyces sp. NPDC055189]
MAVTKAHVAIAAAGGVLMLVTGVGTAQAGPAAPAAPRFAQQAQSAHLTSAQTTALQADVDRYLAKTGGTQTALNKIDLKEKGEILVALPGEARPRDFASGNGTRIAADPCLDVPGVSGNFCAYQRDNFQGTIIKMRQCNTKYYVSTWGRGGSWVNDQTRNLESRRARMYNPSGGLVYKTPRAYSSDAHGDWMPVRYVIPCG